MNIFRRNSTPEKFLEEVTYRYYTDPDTEKNAFFKLSENERLEVSTQLTLHEFIDQKINLSSVKAAAKAGATQETADKGAKYTPASSLSVAYFNKIISSNGNVADTPNYNNNKTLISFAKSAVHSSPETDGSKAFLHKLSEFESAINNLESHANLFAKAIAEENRKIQDESKRTLLQFYVNIVTAVDLGIDTLYSSSIVAVFDTTRAPSFVSRVYFECGKEFLSELVAIVHYFNSLSASGKLRSILSSSSSDLLQVAKEKVLKEESSVIDTVFTIISTNKWTDILLLPLYIIRTVVYIVMYLTASYQKLAFNSSKSIDMIRKERVSEEEFKSYKKVADIQAIQVDQASKKAALDLNSTMKNDTKQIEDLAKTSQTMTSNTLI